MYTEHDREILSVITDNGKIISQRTTEKYLRDHGMYDYMIARYSDNTTGTILESIHRLISDIETTPLCSCGNKIIFSKQLRGFPRWCCRKCQNNDPEMKRINAERVSEYRKWEYANKKEEVMAKKAETLKSHYGDDNNGSPFCCKHIKDKAKKSMLEKYGKESYVLSDEEHKRIKDTIENKNILMWKERGFDVSYTDHKTVIVHNGCKIHGDIELGIIQFNNRMKVDRRAVSTICPLCNPFHVSTGKELVIKEFLDGNDIKYITRTRKVICPMELDFFVKDHNLAIEVNGTFFHSTKKKDKMYHFNKSKKCLDKGIRILHIWEPFIDFRRDLVLSKLKNTIGIECEKIKELYVSVEPSDKYKNFIFANTFYPNMKIGKNAICVYDGEDIVCVMSYKQRGQNVNILNRSCKPYYDEKDCIRIAIGKLVEKIKSYSIDTLTIDLSNDIEDMCFYESLGFEKIKEKIGRHFYYASSYVTDSKIENAILEINECKDDGDYKNRYLECYDSGTATFILKL